MKAWIGILIAALVGATGEKPSSPEPPLTADALMGRVQAYYDRTSSLTADFSQEALRARTGRKNRRSGKVRVLRPNRIRWDYRKPEPVHYVTDGTILWVYQPQDALVYRMGLEQGGLDEAVRFLAGGIRLKDKFKGTLVDAPKGIDRKDLKFLELNPKEEQGGVRKLVIGVDPVSGVVKISILSDPDGNEVRTTYKNLKETTVKKSVFLFEPPPGVRVEDLSGKGVGANSRLSAPGPRSD